MNSVYECGLPLEQAAPHRKGRDLTAGRAPQTLPLIVQGPLLADWTGGLRAPRLRIETGAVTRSNSLSLSRLALWKKARITVQGRPDWLFIKLHCHSMDPTQKDAVIGDAFCSFLQQLVTGAEERKEILHFVTAREMTNILLAACDGRDGNPGSYRDYRFKRVADRPLSASKWSSEQVSLEG
jgi:hypothetical protein